MPCGLGCTAALPPCFWGAAPACRSAPPPPGRSHRRKGRERYKVPIIFSEEEGSSAGATPPQRKCGNAGRGEPGSGRGGAGRRAGTGRQEAGAGGGAGPRGAGRGGAGPEGGGRKVKVVAVGSLKDRVQLLAAAERCWDAGLAAREGEDKSDRK